MTEPTIDAIVNVKCMNGKYWKGLISKISSDSLSVNAYEYQKLCHISGYNGEYALRYESELTFRDGEFWTD